MSIKLKFYKLKEDVILPEKATKSSACFDVRTYFGSGRRFFKVYDKYNKEQAYMAFQLSDGEAVHTILNPGDRALIPTGLVLDIPEGHSVRVHPRSGTSLKLGLGLTNSEGVIDEDYTKELFISVINFSESQVTINHGERIAQIELVKTLEYSLEETLQEITEKTNRVGGFGSTGKQ